MQPTKNEITVPSLTVQQKLLLAVYSLATGSGSLPQRLIVAWRDNLADIEVSDFPKYLQESFTGLQRDLHRITSGAVSASQGFEAVVSEEVAQQLASNVFILSELTTELFNV